MRLWLTAMAALAERFGKAEDAAAYRGQAQLLHDELTPEEPIPEALELPLLLAGDTAVKEAAARRVREDARTVLSLRRALTVLAAAGKEE